MKKTLLSVLAFAMLSTTAFSQGFTHSSTGFSYNCDLPTEAGKFAWAVWTPQNNGGGGTDDVPVNEIGVQWGQGSKGQMYLIFELGTDELGTVDLSANPVVDVMLRSTLPTQSNAALPLTYRVHLEAARGGNTVILTDSILANVTGDKQAFSFDFTNHVKPNVDLKKVTKIVFVYDGLIDNGVYGDPTGNPAKLFFSEFQAGSFVTGVEDELLSRITESVVYPNPATSSVNLKLTLKTASQVKVVLKDVQGKTVKVLTEQTTSAIDQSYSVADLASGLYFVSYQIDGAAVKTQKLLID